MSKLKYNKENIFKYIVLAYFIISPVFDLVFLYNKVTTLIRVLLLLIFVLMIIISKKSSRKQLLFLLAFYLSMLGYLCLEYFHAQGFNSLIPGLRFNLIAEASTILKLCMPFTILFIMKYLDITKNEFLFVINAWTLIIAGSIVITNLLGFSLNSYTDEITNYSIFSWNKGLSVYEIATKGFFSYANQVSIVLLMLLTLVFYEIINERKISHFLFVILIMAMWMLGTRIATYGGLFTLVFITVLYIIYSLIFRRSVSKKIFFSITLIFIWLIILPFTPCNSRVQEIENSKVGAAEKMGVNNSQINKDQIISYEETDTNLQYILNNINHETIGKQFYLDYYPYNYDMDFWRDVINYQKENYLDYRHMELMIVNRLWKIDNRKINYIVGISNSIIQNVVNVERDFVLQFFAFGLVGFLLFVSCYIHMGIVCLKSFKNINFLQLMIVCSFGLFLLSSYMAGNSLNFLSTIVPCAFIVSFMPKYKDC